MRYYKRTIIFLLMLTALTVLWSPSVGGQTRAQAPGASDVLVNGQIVDQNGDPVSGAFVTLYLSCPSCLDTLYPGIFTTESGGFTLAARKGIDSVALFIDPPSPMGSWAPLAQLTAEKRALVPMMAGKIISLRKGDVDLDNVLIPYKYGLVEIDARSFIDQHGLSYVVPTINLRIIDASGRLIRQGRVPPSRWNQQSGSLLIALPAKITGTTWTIEVIGEEAKQRKIRRTLKLTPLETIRLSNSSHL